MKCASDPADKETSLPEPTRSTSPAARAVSSARRRRLANCHSGYIHPGIRNGNRPSTTKTILNINITPEQVSNQALSTPPSAKNKKQLPDSIIIPLAGVISDSVLRPRLNQTFERSRWKSPFQLSENMTNHQFTNVTPPATAAVTPATNSEVVNSKACAIVI